MRLILLYTILLICTHTYGQQERLFDRYPSSEDSSIVEQFGYLLGSEPVDSNYLDYFNVATSYWEMGRDEEAREMLETIVSSDLWIYSAYFRSNSDIPNDTNLNLYGYGSYVWNLKHHACIPLAILAIERTDYREALHLVCLADTVYPLTYNCGTGHSLYRKRMLDLYGYCFVGLNDLESGLNRLLPHCMDWSFSQRHLIELIQNHFSKDSLEVILNNAMETIEVLPDTFISMSMTLIPSELAGYDTTISHYTTGEASIVLFDRLIHFPRPSLEDGEILSVDYMKEFFRTTRFYYELTGKREMMSSDLEDLRFDLFGE